MDCIFCHQHEKHARPHDKEVNSFVCSECIQKFLIISQEQIEKAYNLAVKKEYPEKKFWLKKFISTGEENEPRNERHTSKRFNRKGYLRAIGDEQRTGRKFTHPKRATFHQSQ